MGLRLKRSRPGEYCFSLYALFAIVLYQVQLCQYIRGVCLWCVFSLEARTISQPPLFPQVYPIVGQQLSQQLAQQQKHNNNTRKLLVKRLPLCLVLHINIVILYTTLQGKRSTFPIGNGCKEVQKKTCSENTPLVPGRI